MTEALQRLSEAEEMRDFTAKAHAQNRNVVVEVFHSADGHPLLIHTATVCLKSLEHLHPPDANISTLTRGGKMPLEKRYIRKSGEILGSVTSGFSDESSVVRDEHNNIVGRVSDRFHTTRDDHGKLVSTNTSDPGLLIDRKK